MEEENKLNEEVQEETVESSETENNALDISNSEFNGYFHERDSLEENNIVFDFN